jgi:hypothetical protein
VPLQVGCPRAKPRLDAVPLLYRLDLEKAGRMFATARSLLVVPSTPSRVRSLTLNHVKAARRLSAEAGQNSSAYGVRFAMKPAPAPGRF